MLRSLLVLASVLTTAVVVAATGTVNAQSSSIQPVPAAPPNASKTNTGNGLRISPVRNDLTIKPGESKTVDLYLQNITDSATQVKGVANDFMAGDDESGQPKPLLDENTSAPSHGLKTYIDRLDTFTLQPKEQRIIKVTIRIPADAAGGGYFGLVRFLPTNVDDTKNVSLTASVGSLFLVTVPGDIVEQANIQSLDVARFDGGSADGSNGAQGRLGKASSFFTNGGKDGKGRALQVVLRVKNTGNVQVAPFGKVVLKKSGKELAVYEVNNTTPRGSVLPDSVRKFTVDLGDKTASFGKYSLEGNFGYGNNGQLMSAATSFYVVPLPYLMAAGALLLVVIVGLVAVPRWLRAHDRKLLRKIRGSGSGSGRGRRR